MTHQMNHHRKTGAHTQASSTVLVHTHDPSVGVEAVHTLIWGTALSPLCFQRTALSFPSAASRPGLKGEHCMWGRIVAFVSEALLNRTGPGSPFQSPWNSGRTLLDLEIICVLQLVLQLCNLSSRIFQRLCLFTAFFKSLILTDLRGTRGERTQA